MRLFGAQRSLIAYKLTMLLRAVRARNSQSLQTRVTHICIADNSRLDLMILDTYERVYRAKMTYSNSYRCILSLDKNV